VLLQVDVSCIRYCENQSAAAAESRTSELKELHVREILPRCSIKNSKMDIAFLSHDRNLLLGCIEAKNMTGKLSTAETQKAIKQTILYSVVPLAYSLWGRITEEIAEVVSLLVFPGCVYQLTFTKSDLPFGLELSIETSNDISTMEHILDNYVKDYSELYWKLEGRLVNVNERTDPRDWSPVNFDFERGVERKFSHATEPSLGFMFRAKVETVEHFFRFYAKGQGLFCSMLPDCGEEVLLKYYSAILDLDWKSGASSVKDLILYTIDREKGAKGTGIGDSSGVVQKPYIKHPYIGIISASAHGKIAVMTYTGLSLDRNAKVKSEWLSNADLRNAFLEDVGHCALNLVEFLRLCHNDIRLANITYDGKRFCLIDFENSREARAPTFAKSPVLNGIVGENREAARMMMLSIAQIALVVFALDTKESTCKVWKGWFEAKVSTTTNFDLWVSKTGLTDVFARSRSGQQFSRDFMNKKLLQMLRLEPAT
jgi:hypothetical protein